MSKPIAIFCSDIHLSHNPPALRCLEEDWYEAMSKPLRELGRLAKKLGVPIICAGDIFHKWNSPAELINFALQELPKCYAIPGQHDLPNHEYEHIERSAYWTLVEAGVVKHIEPGSPVELEKLELHGFPWRHEPEPCLSDSRLIKVAVIHKYCWFGKYKYLSAPEENNVSNFQLAGFDAAVIGDNHIGWVDGRVCNCGGFMRRDSPDLQRKPFIGVLMSDLEIKKHLLDVSDDVYSTDPISLVSETGSLELAEFTEGLLGLRTSQDLDFGKVLQRYCRKNGVPSSVVDLIDRAVEEER